MHLVPLLKLKVSNLMKFAFNMKLAGPDSKILHSGGVSGLPSIDLIHENGQSRLTGTFIRRKNSGLTYVLQRSTDLKPASFVTMTGTETVTNISANWERVTISELCDPAAEPQCFVRVKVAMPEQ